MSTDLHSNSIERSPPTIRSGEVLYAALASVWRCKLLVLTIVAVTVLFGLAALHVMPVRYTAQAYIRGGFVAPGAVAKDDNDMSGGSINLDLERVIQTQSQLLQSHELARRVVQQIGLHRLLPRINRSRFLPTEFYGTARDSEDKEESAAASMLLRGLAVTSDPRAYLISIQYSDKDPDFAVLIANAFVAELLRSTKLQALLQQRAASQAILSKRLARFGERYPRVAEARLRVEDTNKLLKEKLREPPEMILDGAGESINKAIATPSGPKASLILSFLFLIGLVIGSGIALWLERDQWWLVFARYYYRPLTWGS